MWFFAGLVGLMGIGSILYWTATDESDQLLAEKSIDSGSNRLNSLDQSQESEKEKTTPQLSSTDEAAIDENQAEALVAESHHSQSNPSEVVAFHSKTSDNSSRSKQLAHRSKRALGITYQAQMSTAAEPHEEDQNASQKGSIQVLMNTLTEGPFFAEMPSGLFLVGQKSRMKDRALLTTETPPIKAKPTREISWWTGLGVGVLGDLQKSSNAQLATGFLAFQYDFRPPFGIVVKAGLTSEFDHQLEYVYTYNEVFLTRREITSTYSALNVNYVHVSPMFTAALNAKHSLSVGGFYNSIYQARGEKGHSNMAVESSQKGWGYHGLLNPTEYGISAQYDYALTEQVKLGVNLQYGLSNRLNTTYFPNGASAYRRALRLTLQKRIR